MDDLITEFIAETTDSLAMLDLELVRLEKNPRDEAVLENVYRVFHTIKGTCGFLGLPRLERVAQASENVVGHIRSHPRNASPEAISLILDALDRIREVIGHLNRHGREPKGNDAPLIAKLDRFAAAGAFGKKLPATAGNELPHFADEDDADIREALDKITATRNAVASIASGEKIVPLAKPVAAKKTMKPPVKSIKPASLESQDIRVNLGLLEEMLQMAGDLVQTRNQLMHLAQLRGDEDFLDPVQRLSTSIAGLQEAAKRARPKSGANTGVPSIAQVLLVQAGGQNFAIPQENIMELVRVAPGSACTLETINNALMLRLRERLLPLSILSELLGYRTDSRALLEKEALIVICRAGGCDFGVIVDHVGDSGEIVAQPVARLLKHIPVYAASTVLGDGSIAMILDPAGIARTVSHMEPGRQEEAQKPLRAESEPLVGFLVFSIGRGAPKSVPLELVSRLEEIPVRDIEIAGDCPVVQYGGELMRLVSLESQFALPEGDRVQVIIFNFSGGSIGLVVREIIDIVHAPFAIKLSSREAREQGYLGSMVIAGRSTDVVDVAHLLAGLADVEVPEIRYGKAVAL